MQQMPVQPLDWEDALEEGMATPPVFLAGESQGQRNLVGYSPCGHKSWTRLSDQTTTTSNPPQDRSPTPSHTAMAITRASPPPSFRNHNHYLSLYVELLSNTLLFITTME